MRLWSVVNSHVQFIDLALAARVLEPPHPLLGRDINLHRLFRSAVDGVINARAPDEDPQADQERNGDPGRFEWERRNRLRWNFSRRATAVFDGEIDFQPGDQRSEKDREADQREKERIDIARETRRPFGQERNEQRAERDEAVTRRVNGSPPALRFAA